MTQLRELLSGKKAYIAGTLLVLLGIVNQDLNQVLEGVSIIALRAGIAKTVDK